MKKTSVTSLQCTLTCIYVAALIISNVVVNKLCSVPWGVILAGDFLFPVVYTLSDVFSECYGYSWSRKTCWIGFACNVIMVATFMLVLVSPYPEYWTDQSAYEIVLGATPRALVASLAAFYLGDLFNDKVFKKMKEKHPNDMKGFGFRAIFSSVAGELVDSIVFVGILFAGEMPVSDMLIMMITEVGLKLAFETVFLPVTTFIVKKVAKHEQQKTESCSD